MKQPMSQLKLSGRVGVVWLFIIYIFIIYKNNIYAKEEIPS